MASKKKPLGVEAARELKYIHVKAIAIYFDRKWYSCGGQRTILEREQHYSSQISDRVDYNHASCLASYVASIYDWFTKELARDAMVHALREEIDIVWETVPRQYHWRRKGVEVKRRWTISHERSRVDTYSGSRCYSRGISLLDRHSRILINYSYGLLMLGGSRMVRYVRIC